MPDKKDNNNLPSHGVKLVNQNNLSYRVAQIEKWMDNYAHDNQVRLVKLDDRVDAQATRTGQYYSVITPEEVKKSQETIHKNTMDIDSMGGRFNEFTTDRVRRLEVANEKIHVLEDEIREAETRISAKVDLNKIKQQQYVIGIVVGLIVTFIAASVMAFLHA